MPDYTPLAPRNGRPSRHFRFYLRLEAPLSISTEPSTSISRDDESFPSLDISKMITIMVLRLSSAWASAWNSVSKLNLNRQHF
jgi:hypothetical protein